MISKKFHGVFVVVYMLCFLLIDLIYLFPFYYLFGMSLGMKIFGESKELFPSNPNLSGYVEILTQPQFVRNLTNSFIYSICITLGVILMSSLVGYAFSRLEFPGKEYLFWVIMVGMMVPGIINYIPLYVMLSRLGLINTYIGVILPPIGSAYSAFLLRQSFESIPKEFEEAAIIDGASRVDILFKIFMPIIKPPLVTLALFQFVWNWNNFAWPIFVTTRREMYTLPLVVLLMSQTEMYWYIKFNTLAAGAVICMLPPFILFVIAVQYFLKGIVIAGLKK